MGSKMLTSSTKVENLFWYLFCGVLHEGSHVLTASLLGLSAGLDTPVVFLAKAALGRACSVPALLDDQTLAWKAGLVQHAGWIFSAVLALFLVFYGRGKKNMKPFQSAAVVTALEALSTDLLGIGIVAGVSSATLFCGNFGVILLHSGWTDAPGDYGKTALDLLQKMIEVTMMRGAQTGGVVTWVNNKDGGGAQPIRSRVVNGKRTDLSQEIRKKLDLEICSGGKLQPSIRCLMGHTRFATTSKATMDGCHPHTWSAPEPRRIYPDENAKLWGSNTPFPVTRNESNYITHNGDLDFFKINGQHFDLHTVQKWLELATGHDMPATVDSAAIAGLVDVLRTGGCFGLSLRFALLVGSSASTIKIDAPLPTYDSYESLGMEFEAALKHFCTERTCTLSDLKTDTYLRSDFTEHVADNLPNGSRFQSSPLKAYLSDSVSVEDALHGISVHELIEVTINAFFDNDIYGTTKLLLRDSVGSFGLMVTTSAEAQRQICIAARGQPMSIVFYPKKGLITYGSELAAVKAGLIFDAPKTVVIPQLKADEDGKFDVTKETCRFDLDDLGGEVVLVDISEKTADGRSIPHITAHQESMTTGPNLKDRTTILDNNEFLLPLTKTMVDPIQDDIQNIPAVTSAIQADWQEGGLNRVSAWSLGRCLRRRLKDRVDGKVAVNASTVDILVTGCEVSLWIGEQFASDLRKAFPKLFVQAISSNKILGVFGQDLAVPAIGFPMSDRTPDLKDTIVIIVSHSGGTFAPLAVSNLLQSVTRNIFVVASEWDTQIGKQLRSMSATEADNDFLTSRVFTTNIGVRPAEPCSLSVVATHQLLTQIFQYLSMVILSNHHFRHLAGAVITERDLQVLERCNQDNISALESIVATTVTGAKKDSVENEELKKAGALWADHILENARAYILSFIYIVVTVTIGYPLITGIAHGCGLDTEWAFYITRFFDSLLYFFLPQINITIIRLVQGRNLLHRMVGRTAVIGDIPWVAQSAEAFLSKIFARSYSIAGLGVLSGNPADHLVHRHTHRVVRGSLLICGRPDGRLAGLTSGECAVNLSVCQASSIQSIDGTCESITIGHNPSKLSLTKMDIALAGNRPKFLCEHILGEVDKETGTVAPDRGAHSLKGLYLGMQEKAIKAVHASMAKKKLEVENPTGLRKSVMRMSIAAFADVPKDVSIEEQVLFGLLQENEREQELKEVFAGLDDDGNGTIGLEEFVQVYQMVRKGMPRDKVETIFHEADVDDSGALDYEEFREVMAFSEKDVLRSLQQANLRDENGILQVQASAESYFGEGLNYPKSLDTVEGFSKSCSQHLSMELYESRFASLQRFVGMCVMFHHTGKTVQDFFPRFSFGLMRYNMERTHSIMRIATTASPVSGDAVRAQMERLRLRSRFLKAGHTIAGAWRRADLRRMQRLKMENSTGNLLSTGALLTSQRSVVSTDLSEDASEDSPPVFLLEAIAEPCSTPVTTSESNIDELQVTFMNTTTDPKMATAELY